MKRYFILIAFIVLYPSLVFSTSYYVKNGGNDSNTGLSDAQAWATISKVNSFSFNAGDDVYFKCGDSWNTKTDDNINIDWSGTGSSNYAVVGAYYMDGSETVGVNEDGKPLFDGGWDTTQDFDYIVSPWDADYVRIQDLEMYNSYGFGYVGHSGYGNSYVTLRRLTTNYTGRTGIKFNYCSTGGIVEYCDISEDNIRFAGGGYWGPGIAAQSNGCIIRYNYVYDGYGEGINVGGGQSNHDMTVEKNVVWARKSYGIYIDGGYDCTVRYNVVFGTTNAEYHSTTAGERTWNPMGIAINSETSNLSLRNKVYSNVAAGCYRGYQVMNLSGGTIDYDDRSYFYNNTAIDNYSNFYVHPTQCSTTEFKNNLSIVNNDGVHLNQTYGNGHVFFKTIALSTCYLPLGNMWSGTGSSDIGDWSDEPDVVGNANIYKTSGWQSISSVDAIDIAASVRLLSGSDAIDSAQNLGSVYDDIIYTEGSDYNTPDPSDISTPIVVSIADQDSYGDGWEFGAVVYEPPSPAPTILPPTGFTLSY